MVASDAELDGKLEVRRAEAVVPVVLVGACHRSQLRWRCGPANTLYTFNNPKMIGAPMRSSKAALSAPAGLPLHPENLHGAAEGHRAAPKTHLQ